MSERTNLCTVENCGSTVTTSGLCRSHYWKLRRERLKKYECSAPDCGKAQYCKTLCRGHYARLRLGKSIDVPLHKSESGNVTLICRISAEALKMLKAHAAAAKTSAPKIAARLILRELGLEK